MIIPVGVEPASMTAGYLGLFGFFLGGLTGPFAILLGFIGIKQLRKKPKLRGISRAWTGIVLGVLQCVLLLMILIRFMN